MDVVDANDTRLKRSSHLFEIMSRVKHSTAEAEELPQEAQPTHPQKACNILSSASLQALGLLLEDPGFVLQGELAPQRCWCRKLLEWQKLPGSAEYDHFVVDLPRRLNRFTCIQLINLSARRLSFDRQCCFRLHRFTLHDSANMNAVLMRLGEKHRESGGVVASNVGGFHSETTLFNDPESSCFQSFLEACTEAIEMGDQSFRGEEG